MQVAKPASLGKLREEISGQLDIASKRLSNQTRKAQKMWNKVRRPVYIYFVATHVTVQSYSGDRTAVTTASLRSTSVAEKHVESGGYLSSSYPHYCE